MNKIKLMVLGIALFLCAHESFSQEVAPLKTFEFSIGINQLKTQDQANLIIDKVDQISGVTNCSLVLIDYVLVFQCTNHDLSTYNIMDIVKQVVLEEGADITIINRETIK
jgi:hypothetical protein